MIKNSVAVILKQGEKFSLGKRLNQGNLANKWEFIGGKVEKDETVEQAINREIKEELNIEIFDINFIEKVFFEKKNFFLHAFYVQTNTNLNNITPLEHQEFGFFTYEQLFSLDMPDSDKLLLDKIKNI